MLLRCRSSSSLLARRCLSDAGALADRVRAMDSSALDAYLAKAPFGELQSLRPLLLAPPGSPLPLSTVCRESDHRALVGLETRHVNAVLGRVALSAGAGESVAWYRAMRVWGLAPDADTFAALMRHSMRVQNWDLLFYVLAETRLCATLSSDARYRPVLQQLVRDCEEDPGLRWRYAVHFLLEYARHAPLLSEAREARALSEAAVRTLGLLLRSHLVAHGHSLAHVPPDHLQRLPQPSPQVLAAMSIHSRMSALCVGESRAVMDGKYLCALGTLLLVGRQHQAAEELLLPRLLRGSPASLDGSSVSSAERIQLCLCALLAPGAPKDFGYVEVTLGLALLIAVDEPRLATLAFGALLDGLLASDDAKTTKLFSRIAVETLKMSSTIFQFRPETEALYQVYCRLLSAVSPVVRIDEGRVRADATGGASRVQEVFSDLSAVDDMIRVLRLKGDAERALSVVFVCEEIDVCIRESSFVVVSQMLLERREFALVVELFELFRARQSGSRAARRPSKRPRFPPFETSDAFLPALVALGEAGDVRKMIATFLLIGKARLSLQPSALAAVLRALLSNGKDYSKCGVLLFRRVYGLPVPAHMAPAAGDVALYAEIFAADLGVRLRDAPSGIIQLALRCCAAGLLGKDALDLIVFAEGRTQSNQRMAELDLGSAMVDWELVVLAISTRRNINLIPQVLSIISCMERPVSATRRLLKICMAAVAVVDDEGSATAAVLQHIQNNGNAPCHVLKPLTIR